MRLGLIIIHFMVYLIMYKKPSTLSFSTTVFIFSTYGLDPWRQYRTGISMVHILVYTECVSGDYFLSVCLELRSVNDMTLIPTLRGVRASNCEHVFTLMSVGKRRHSSKRWSWKKFNSCVVSVNVCSVGPIRII